MKAGRELDALVAEHVMEDLIWDIWFEYDGVLRSTDPNGISYKCQDKDQAESYLKEFPSEWIPKIMGPDPEPYSTDIAAAWDLIKCMEEKDRPLGKWGGFSVNSNEDGWTACFWREYAFGDSGPHAICLAALKAIGCKPD